MWKTYPLHYFPNKESLWSDKLDGLNGQFISFYKLIKYKHKETSTHFFSWGILSRMINSKGLSSWKFLIFGKQSLEKKVPGYPLFLSSNNCFGPSQDHIYCGPLVEVTAMSWTKHASMQSTRAFSNREASLTLCKWQLNVLSAPPNYPNSWWHCPPSCLLPLA